MTDISKPKIEPPRNTLEKLIRLDKKNSNFNMHDFKTRKKLKIRNIMTQSTCFQALPADYGLRMFWKHIENYYFRLIGKGEIERIDYLQSILAKDWKVENKPSKYTDWKSYWTIKSNISNQAKHAYPDPSLSKLNYQNLLKHYKISTKLSFLLNQDQMDGVKLGDLNYVLHHKYVEPHKNGEIESFLKEEEIQLNDLLFAVDGSESENNELSDEISLLQRELNKLNHKNTENLNKLKELAEAEMNKDCILMIRNSDETKKKVKSLKGVMSKEKELIVKFLKYCILKLEFKQLAESIEFVAAASKFKKDCLFEVCFEKNLNSKMGRIEEEVMVDLDKQRENSLFTCYNIPQKGIYSFISQNFYGFEKIHSRDLKSMPPKGKSLLPQLRKQALTESGDRVSNLSHLNDFSMCHHCKCYFLSKNLIKCNYRSSIMGTPIVNRNNTAPSLYCEKNISNSKSKDVKKRSLMINRKKNNYCHYSKKMGEYFCEREFCRICLKQNYDFNLSDILNKSDWICPFCQGVCFCTRCLRNNLLSKIKGMFMFYGGNCADITKESLFEKHIVITESPPSKLIRTTNLLKKSFLSPHQRSVAERQKLLQLKTRLREYKRKMRDYQKIKYFRTSMEKLRFLSSQIIRREKIKMKLFLTSQSLLPSYLSPSLLPPSSLLPPPSLLSTSSVPPSSPSSLPPPSFPPPPSSFLQKKRGTLPPSSHPPPPSLNSLKRRLPSPLLRRSFKKVHLDPDVRGSQVSENSTGDSPVEGNEFKNKIGVGKKEEEGGRRREERGRREEGRKIKEEGGKKKKEVKNNRWFKLMRRTAKKLIKNEKKKRGGENPNEPSDFKEKPSTLRSELKDLLRTQNMKELMLVGQVRRSGFQNKNLRSWNPKLKLRSNKLIKI